MLRKALTLVALLFFCPIIAHPSEDAPLYSLGKNFAKRQEKEFAYMQFRDIVLHFPGSRFREGALFATGEYFYSITDYTEATKTFKQFSKEYPTSKNKIFALGYLYKIAEIENDEILTAKLRTELITLQQVSFVFRNSKQHIYRSPFHKSYRAVIRINRIAIDSEGEILAEISY